MSTDNIKKRFPADTKTTYMTFLNDKKNDGELYAYFQSVSMPMTDEAGNKITIVEKAKLPTVAEICKKVSVKSRQTYYNHLNYMIKQGYIIEKDNYYILPNMEDFFFMVPLPTLQYLLDNCRSHVIKIYVYLGQCWNYKGKDYEFSLEEIGEHIGIKINNNTRNYQIIQNALDLLVNSELLNYVEFFDGRMKKKKLTMFSFTHKAK